MKQGKRMVAVMAVAAFIVLTMVPMIAFAAVGGTVAKKTEGDVVAPGGTVAVTASLSGLTDTKTYNLTWSSTTNGATITGANSVTASGDTATAEGTLNVPADATGNINVTVTATQAGESTDTGTATGNISVSTLTITEPDPASITKGDTEGLTLTATPNPADATVTWTVDPPVDGVTVTNGKVTATTACTATRATIKASIGTAPAVVSATQEITIVDPPAISLPDTISVTAGVASEITATITGATTGTAITWTASAGDVSDEAATIVADQTEYKAKITVPLGTTSGTIRVQVGSPDNLDSTAKQLTITQPTVTVTPTTAAVGSNVTMAAALNPEIDGTSVTWAIDPAADDIATITSGGVLTPVSGGTVTVKATITKDGGTLEKTQLVTITQDQDDSATVELTPAENALTAGQTVQLQVKTTGVQGAGTVTVSSSADGVTFSTDGTSFSSEAELGVAAGTATNTVWVKIPSDAPTGTVVVTAELAGSSNTASANINVTAATDNEEPSATPTTAPSSSASSDASATASPSVAPTVRPDASAAPSATASTSPAPTTSTEPSSSSSPGESSEPTSSESGAPSPVVTEPVTINPDAEDVPDDLQITENPAVEGSVLEGAPISTPEETTTVQSLASWIAVPEGGSVQIINAQGQEAPADSPVATGMMVEVLDENGRVIERSTVVVKGDVTGSGEINLTQLVRLAAAYVGSDPLSGAYAAAADLNGDGTVSLTDLVLEARLYRDADMSN